MIQAIIGDTRKKMESCIVYFQKELAKIRTGRASISLFDSIQADYYNTMTPLKQLANISTPDSQTLNIQPWDVSSIPNIEKAILSSDLGLNPMNDGKIIRVTIPPLTEERRKQLAKVVKKEAEECRIAIRNVRRDSMDRLKKLEKDKEISQDDQKKGQEEIQNVTNTFVKKTDEINDKKEKEILED